jgi:hypothetical protein
MSAPFGPVDCTHLDGGRHHLVESVQPMAKQKMTAVVNWAAAELGRANSGVARLNRRLDRLAARLRPRLGNASSIVLCGDHIARED